MFCMLAMSAFKLSFYLYTEAGAVFPIVHAHTGHEGFDEH